MSEPKFEKITLDNFETEFINSWDVILNGSISFDLCAGDMIDCTLYTYGDGDKDADELNFEITRQQYIDLDASLPDEGLTVEMVRQKLAEMGVIEA